MEESTLDAFAEEASEADESRPQGGVEPSTETDDPADGTEGSVDEGDPPSVRVTYRFSTERRECRLCGESGREHWAGEAGFVCPACVEW